MTVTDQVIAQAQQLAGDSQDSELLNLLCRAAVSSLAAQLREGFTPESCREDFVTAARPVCPESVAAGQADGAFAGIQGRGHDAEIR